MSELLTDILKKDLYRRISTDKAIPAQEEPVGSGLTPEQQAEVLQMDFDNVQEDFKRGVRFFPSAGYSYSFRANKSPSGRPYRNHREVEYGQFFGADLLAEGLEGSVTAGDIFATPGYRVDDLLDNTPYTGTYSASDLRLVILDADDSSSGPEQNLGSYEITSTSSINNEVKVASNTFDTSNASTNASYKYAIVAFQPPKLVPVKSAGKETLYMAVLPDEYPVYQKNPETGKTEFLAKNSFPDVDVTFNNIVNEQLSVDIDNASFSVGDTLALRKSSGEVGIFVVESVSGSTLSLTPFRGFDIKDIKGLSSFPGNKRALELFKVKEFTSNPYKSPGEDHTGSHVNALFNSPFLDWIRVKNIVPPKNPSTSKGTVGLFDTDIRAGMGLSLVPESGSGNPSLSDSIVNFSDVTIDSSSSNPQEIFVDWEEGLIRFSDPIPNSGGDDLNPNNQADPDLWASFVSYQGPKSPQEASKLRHRGKGSVMEVAPSHGADLQKSSRPETDPIEDTQGWIAYLGDNKRTDRTQYYHNFPDSDTGGLSFSNRDTDGGYNPAVGFDFDHQDAASEIRFQRRDLDDSVSGRWRRSAIRTGRTKEGNDIAHNQIAIYPEINDSGWDPSSGKGTSVRFVSLYHKSTGYVDDFSNINDDQFDANINGENVTFTYNTSGTRSIESDIVPELRNKIENKSSLTHGEDFFVRAEINPSNPHQGQNRLVLEATDYLNILTGNDPYFSSGEGEIVNTWMSFGKGGDIQNRMRYHNDAGTVDWGGEDITVDGVGGLSGPAGAIEKGLFSMQLSGFEIKSTSSVTGGVEVDVKAGTYAATKHGPTNKTVRSIPETTNISLDNGEEYYLVPDSQNSQVKAVSRGDITGLSSVSKEEEVPLWYFRIKNDSVVEQEDLRHQFERFQADQPIVVGDQNLHSMNMRQAIELARYQDRFSSSLGGLGGGQKIVMRGDATLPTDGSSPVELPFGLTIEGNGNILEIDNWTSETTSVIKPQGRNEIRNVTFQINNARWERTVNNHKEPVAAGAFHSNTDISYSDLKLTNCQFDTNPVPNGWIKKVTVSDDSNEDETYEITINLTNGTDQTFTKDDPDPGNDKTTEIANNLASQIDGATIGSSPEGNFSATHDGFGEIFIEEDSHLVDYTISVDITNNNSPSANLTNDTSNLLKVHNTLNVITQEGGGKDTSIVNVEKCSSDEGSIQIWNGTGNISIKNLRLDKGDIEVRGSVNNTTDVHISQAQCRKMTLRNIDGNTFINQASVDKDVELKDCTNMKIHEVDINEPGNASTIPLTIKKGNNWVVMRGQLSSIHIPNSSSGACSSISGPVDDLTLVDCYFDASTSNDDCLEIGKESTTITERIEIKGCRFERSSGSSSANGIYINDSNTDPGIFVENCIFDEFDMDNSDSRSIFIDNDGNSGKKHQAVNNSVRPSGADDITYQAPTDTIVAAGNIFY